MDLPTLDELYFNYLVELVGGSSYGRKTYLTLLKRLFEHEYIWVVPNDDNRTEDGRDLRHEFAEQLNDFELNSTWFESECSMLELIIGLSRRLAFEAEGEPRDWFWVLLKNLSLTRYSDNWRRFPERKVEDILNQVIWRTYEPDGSGGLFPLSNPNEDQRKVELWYQLCAYVLEMGKF